MPRERKHSAIMFTDIVGYTALMGSDEDKAFEILSRNKEIHSKLIEKYNGTLIKEMGDGMLVSFDLASDAVYCAIEIQKECRDKEIPLKIGIHEGELVLEGTDVLGDAVNIASRLEADTNEGCIYISGSVYRDIKNKSDIQTKFVKEKRFKNVDEPIRVYQVLCEEKKESTKTNVNTNTKINRKKYPILLLTSIVVIITIAMVVWKLFSTNNSVETEKSIAVLPFKNLSSEEENQYFADGVMEGILNHLSKINDLRVASRTSVEKYRKSAVQSPQISKELNVSYLLEASVFKSENKIRVTAQLIDAKSDEHIWSGQYDRELKDVFAVMSDISQEVASEIKIIISPKVKNRIESIPTKNLKAYDFYLRANSLSKNRNYTDSVINLYKKAIELDTQFALAYLGLGTFIHSSIHDTAPSTSVYFDSSYGDTLIYYANKALSIDPELSEGYVLLGEYYFDIKGDFDKCIELGNKALELNPNNLNAIEGMAESFLQKGDFIKVFEYRNKLIERSIGTPSYYQHFNRLGKDYLAISDYKKAEKIYKDVAENYPFEGFFHLSRLSAIQGNWDEMRFYANKVCAIDSGKTCLRELGHYYYYTRKWGEAKMNLSKYRENLQMNLYVQSHYEYAYVLYQLNEKNEAIKLFNELVEAGKECLRLGRICVDRGKSGVKYLMAGSYACLGEKKKTYDLLHEMENEVFFGEYVGLIQFDPHFESLWEDQEFKDILKRQEEKYTKIRKELDQLRQEGML